MTSRLTRYLLLPVGTAGLIIFLAIAHASTTEIPYDPFGTSRFPWTIAFVGFLMAAQYGFGLPDLPDSRLSALGYSVLAAGTAVLAVSAFQLALGSALLPRLVVGGGFLVSIPWSLLCWLAHNDVNALVSTRVFVVGHPDEVAALRADLAADSERSAEVVRGVAPNGAEAHDLTEDVLDSGAEVLILSLEAQGEDRIVERASELHERGIRIRTLSLFTEEYLGKIPLGEMERMSLLFDIGEVHRARYVRAKRVVDVTVSLIGLIPLALVLPIVVIGNTFDNRGPLFYRQERVGKDNQLFTMLKFRSMAPSTGSSTWTSVDDDRVSSFGNFLRKSHIDELPQVINVLRGDLSIVGPRPEQPIYVKLLGQKLPYYEARHMVRPGLTGWAQIKHGYASDEDDAREKLQYDLHYLRRQSVALDIRILVRTVRTVLLGTGR